MQKVIKIIEFLTKLSRHFKKKKTVKHIQQDVRKPISVEKQDKVNIRLQSATHAFKTTI